MPTRREASERSGLGAATTSSSLLLQEGRHVPIIKEVLRLREDAGEQPF